MKRCGLLSLAIILAVSPAALSQTPGGRTGSAKQQIVALTAQWLRAEETRNIAFLENLLAPDFSVMTGSGHTMNKAALLAALRSPRLTMSGLRSDPIGVRVYGNVAILIDRTTIGGVNDGKPFGSVVRFVRVYVRQRGRWRAEYAQATLLKSAAGR
ncbi:MAG: nuclear transport factor 2 family protein [Terriglobia bacterium]